MNKKIFSLLILISLLAFTLVACEAANGNDIPDDENTEVEITNEDDNNDIDNQDEVDEDLDEENKDDKIIVELYFPTNEYIETGDISKERFGTEKRELDYNNHIIESVYNELIRGPEDSSSLTTVLDNEIELDDSYIKDNTAYLDFNSSQLHGGSLEEAFFIDQIVGSLLSIDGIEQVQFLVDGSGSGSLMGHFIIDEPFTDLSSISE